VSSFVSDTLMSPIGILLGKMDFSNLFINISGKSYNTIAEARAVGTATINYGIFFNTLIDFVIVAFAIFLLIRQINRLKRQPEASLPVPTTKECSYRFTAIPVKKPRCPHCTYELKGGD